MKKPHGSSRDTKNYIKNELGKLKIFFDNNLDFYKYYRTNSTYLDHMYFVRGIFEIKLSLDTYYFESDPFFSTSHDFKVAKIIANDLIQVYLEDQLLNIQRGANNHMKNSSLSSGLQWTANKTSLTELIYALHATGVFENGKMDIKRIANFFESIFEVDLGDFYHTYLELKNRKINKTKFIDILRENLLNKMEEQDL